MRHEYSYRQPLKVATDDMQILRIESGYCFHNLGATGTITVKLPTDADVGDTFKFAVAAAQAFRIDPPSDETIIAAGNGSEQLGKYIWADDEGENITLTKITATKWLATAEHGTWTFE